MDASGNLYGVTVAGGVYRGGTVFELSPTTSGEWDHKILYNFNCADKGGCGPYGSLIFDHSGNLYGTTSTQGLQSVGGTVYELVSNADASWTEKVLHRFSDNGVDGYRPLAGLVSDDSGNLYGTTNQGGAYGVGTVFELSPTPEGAYAEQILHSFGDGRQDGYQPYYGSLILDAAGNLYGTTVEGGAYQGGTVFEITP
jgi:uncharacterized repeat protein (TIGR03803 family)